MVNEAIFKLNDLLTSAYFVVSRGVAAGHSLQS